MNIGGVMVVFEHVQNKRRRAGTEHWKLKVKDIMIV
jgi:hypothetical protein